MQDLERVRYVTANYSHLRGLRKVPIGLFLLLMLAALLVIARVWQPEEDAVISTMVLYPLLSLVFMAFAGTIMFYYLTNVYYERRYGSVELFSHVPTRRKVLYGTIVVAVLLRGTLSLFLLGVTMLIAYWPERRFQVHYVAMAALAIVFSLSLMVGFILSLTLVPGAFDLMWGLTKYSPLYTLTTVSAYFIVGGVLDHLLLVRTMKPLPEEGDGGAL